MKKIGRICLAICFLLTFLNRQQLGFAASVETTEATQPSVPEDTATTANSCHGIDANSYLLGSGVATENVRAAFLYETTSDTLMFAYNPDEHMHPASLVKLLTAMIAIDKGNLTDVVTVTESAVSSIPYDAVSEDALQAGEQITLEDLLYFMLVGSANDAAAVIAEHISGSQNQFVQLMNQYAQELGCIDTQLVNPHGLHNDGQYTTARDVIRILDAAMDNESFRTVFTATEHTIAATNMAPERELFSRNSMMDTSSKLYYDSRVIGGRTGVAGDGRRCLASAAEFNGMQLISVVMGSETVYQEDGYSAVTVGGYKETTALLDAGFNGYQSAQILYANQTLRQCEVTDGECDVILGPQVSVSTVLPDGVSSADLTFRYTDVPMRAPIEQGEMLSSLEIWHGNMCVAQVQLYAMNSVDIASQQTADAEEDSDPGSIKPVVIILVTAVVLVGIVLLFRSYGKIRGWIAKYRNKRYRRSRRRSK